MTITIKDGLHVVAIDDAPHIRGDATTELFFTYCKSTFLETVTHKTVSVDGMDATDVILEELYAQQDRFTLIILHGITVAGLNIVDIHCLYKVLQIPILAVTENSPAQNSIYNAIERLNNSKLRKKLLDKTGSHYLYYTSQGSTPIFYYTAGISEKLAKEFFMKFCVRSKLPEQLLLAHKIASAWK